MRRLQSLAAAAVLALTGAAGTAGAQTDAPTQTATQTATEPRTWLQLQATSASWRMQTRGDYYFSQQSTPPLQLESELGLPEGGTISGIAFGRRIGQRWRIELEHTSSRRRGGTVLQREVAADGVLFRAGTPIQSDVKLSTLRVNGGVSLWMSPEAEFGLTFGGEWVELARRFEGSGVPDFAPPQQAPSAQRTSSRDTAPIPVLGLYGHYAFAPAWRVTSRAEFGVGGASYRKLSAGVQWRATPHLALGAGYRQGSANLDVLFGFIGCCTHLVLDYQAHGPALSLNLSF